MTRLRQPAMHTRTLPSLSSSFCPSSLVLSEAPGAATAAHTSSGSVPASLMRFCNA